MIFLEKIFSFARNFEGKTARLTPVAFENDCHGVVFNVLGWNKPAIGFYLKLGLNSGANGRPLVCVDVHLKQSQLRCTESTDSNARPAIQLLLGGELTAFSNLRSCEGSALRLSGGLTLGLQGNEPVPPLWRRWRPGSCVRAY